MCACVCLGTVVEMMEGRDGGDLLMEKKVEAMSSGDGAKGWITVSVNRCQPFLAY